MLSVRHVPKSLGSSHTPDFNGELLGGGGAKGHTEDSVEVDGLCVVAMICTEKSSLWTNSFMTD